MSPAVKRGTGQHHGDLRNVLLAAALELVAESGPRGFTVAEAARRAGVSLAAPYKHFADRDALLAALGERGYQEQERRFTAAVATSGDPAAQLVAAAVAYLDFAVQERPLFEVLFGSGLVKADHPSLAAAGTRVLSVLLPTCTAIRPQAPEELLVAVAALAHGYAVFLLEGALGDLDQALPGIRALVARGTRVLAATPGPELAGVPAGAPRPPAGGPSLAP